MKAQSNFKWIVSLMLISLCSMVFGQDAAENTIQDQLYREYKANGIEQSLETYQKLNTDKAYNGFQEPLNMLGYRLMQDDKDMEAAKKVFEAQIAEYSSEANPYDSYADLLLEMGNTAEAKKNFQKSVSLAEKSDKDLDQQIYRSSKAKLAKMENKHRMFEFLDGSSNVEITNFEANKEAGKNNFHSEASYDESGNVLTINFTNQNDISVGKRIVVYDAVEDQYDMAFLNASEPMGIRLSHIKVKDLGNNKMELMESYVDRKGKDQSVRHEIMKKDGAVEWVIYEQIKDSKDWEKVVVQNFKKP